MRRRDFIALQVIALLGGATALEMAAIPPAAHAQTYPTRPITIMSVKLPIRVIGTKSFTGS